MILLLEKLKKVYWPATFLFTGLKEIGVGETVYTTVISHGKIFRYTLLGSIWSYNVKQKQIDSDTYMHIASYTFESLWDLVNFTTSHVSYVFSRNFTLSST